MNEVTQNLKDAAYVLIGLGVIGYQKAQAQGEELRKRVEDQRVQLDKQVEGTREQLTKVADKVVGQALQAAKEAETTVRRRLTRAA